ncbi:MAG: hypothetical protein GY932_11840 [Arcobacter sp.]|nr:hypothetical protein [Arcobacter sp.]
MKRNYWPLLFIGIFSFTFIMIVWTVYSAIKTPVHEDESFLKKYHVMDDEFNNVVSSNTKFKERYNFNIKINDKSLPLIINDVFLSQRVIEEKSNHKKIFINGNNNIDIVIKDKNGIIQENVDISFRISRPTNHNNTMDFTTKDFIFMNDKYSIKIDLPLKGNWNVTATFKIGKEIGYLFIKSDAI